MNKRLFTLCALAAAFVTVGCQKEQDVNQITPVEKTHSLVFTAEKAGETRTAIASEADGVVSYKWISGDDARMHIYETHVEDGENKTIEGTVTQMDLTSDGKTATFHVTFEGDAPEGTLKYNATYGGVVSDKGNPYIPSEQKPGLDTFDPAADALFASEITKAPRDENPTFKFDMTRIVSVNKMTLKGLPAGEKVTSVTFESDKYHYGYMSAAGNLTNSGKKLILTYTENNTIPENGQFPVYFTTAPVENATFTVTVLTDNDKRFVKKGAKTISFAAGQVRRFGVDLTDCEAPEGRTFTLVESVDDLVIGSDVVIAANGSKNTAMSIVQNNNNRGTTEATKSSDYKTLTITEQVQVFTLKDGKTEGTYAFLCVNGNNKGYLYAPSKSSNYLRTKEQLDESGSWSISISSNEATIKTTVEETDRIIRYNSGNDIFSTYNSGQQSVFIYQAAGLPSPGMSWSAEAATATITATGIDFTAPTLTPGNATGITYNSSVPAVATISDEGDVEILRAGTTTISAVFAGNNEYAPSTVSYELTVTDSREKAATPTFSPAAGAVAEGTTVTISSTTEGATIYYTVDGTTPTTESTQGTTVTINEAKTIKAIAVKEGYLNSEVGTAAYTIMPAATTIATILADNEITSSNTKNYSVAGVTVMAVQGKNYIIGDATGVMLMYSNVSPALVVGNQYDVQGEVKLYNGVHEFNGPTVQASTGTAPSYGTPEEMTVTSLTAYTSAPITKYAKVYVTAPSSGFVCSDGTNSVNVYDGTGTFANYYGKPIIVTGYLIGYYSGKINIIATAIEQDVVSFLSVTPETLTWAAGEYGSSVAKTVTVSIDDNASGYSVSGSSSDWTVSDDENGTITVYPNAANTSTTTNKTLTLTITHADDASLSKTVECSQSKVVSGTTVTSSNLGSASTTATAMDDEISYVNSAANTYSNPMRIYANNTFTISSKTKNITTVVYTCNSDSYANVLNNATFTVDSGASVSKSVNGNKVTVTITGATKSVAAKASAQWRLDALSVTYN